MKCNLEPGQIDITVRVALAMITTVNWEMLSFDLVMLRTGFYSTELFRKMCYCMLVHTAGIHLLYVRKYKFLRS